MSVLSVSSLYLQVTSYTSIVFKRETSNSQSQRHNIFLDFDFATAKSLMTAGKSVQVSKPASNKSRNVTHGNGKRLFHWCYLSSVDVWWSNYEESSKYWTSAGAGVFPGVPGFLLPLTSIDTLRYFRYEDSRPRCLHKNCSVGGHGPLSPTLNLHCCCCFCGTLVSPSEASFVHNVLPTM